MKSISGTRPAYGTPKCRTPHAAHRSVPLPRNLFNSQSQTNTVPPGPSTSSILGTGADKARQWRRIVSISSVKLDFFCRRLRFSETLSASVWCAAERAAALCFTFRPRGGILFLGGFCAYNHWVHFQALFYSGVGVQSNAMRKTYALTYPQRNRAQCDAGRNRQRHRARHTCTHILPKFQDQID